MHVQLKSGGRLLLYCMSDANKDPYTGPERLSKAQLEALYSVNTMNTLLIALITCYISHMSQRECNSLPAWASRTFLLSLSCQQQP